MSFQQTLYAISELIVPAAIYAALAAVLFAGIRMFLLRREKRSWDRSETIRLLFFSYLAALVEITVFRVGAGYVVRQVQLIPLAVTFAELEFGVWALVYPILGNLIWFVPMGILLPLAYRKADALWKVTLFSACFSFLIELSQYLRASGISDIDDLLFNTLGGMLGYGILLLYRLIRKK